MSGEPQEEDGAGRPFDRVLARRLLAHLRPYARWVWLAVLLLFCNSLLQLVGPYLTKIAIDDHIRVGDLHGLGRLALLYLGVVLLDFTLEYAQFYVMQWVGQQIMFDLRSRIMRHLVRLELGFYDHNPVGRLMTRVMGDVGTLHELFTTGVVAIFGDFLTLVGIVIAMFLLDWRLALVANLVLPALFLISLLFRARVRTSYRIVRGRVAAMNAFLQEHLTGMRVVQLFGREGASLQKFAGLNGAHREAHLRTILYYALFYPAVELVSAAATALIVWYGGGRVVQNSLELGVLVAFLQYAERFFRPISDLAEKYNTFQSAMASSERLFRLLDREPRLQSPPSARRLERARGHVVFDDVHFEYKPGEPVLEGLSFEVQPGERVAVVGATGAGKTSVLSVLTRLYDIQRGRILLDGIDVRSLDLTDLRRQVGVVLQDPFLFAGSIESNIRLGEARITSEQVQEAARLVHAERFIAKLPEGYTTEVSERGSTLSVGQRQLLALARVLAFDPAVLVLDEATSSVDTETELEIRDAVHRVLAGRTSLVVAHRLSTIQDCDRILVLHRGRLREAGSHAELLRAGGIYARLYELQFRDQAA
ncbi:MAG TPA: ABC transporter ATP-binding protein [Candidatus Krumholzibacteria bacterium]|nr:ABC transporter ATP-binding protein [Candidatus Krumholzibacteria bacterium]